jgi:transposase-like protein
MSRPRKYTHDKCCPECGSNWGIKHGYANGKQQHKCKGCDRRFTEGGSVMKYP